MPKREETTLEAINTLKKRYPYAASLLVYVLIEQELKFWLLRNRGHYKRSRVDDSIVIKQKKKRIRTFRSYSSLNDQDFKRRCLHKCTLGKLERILRIKSRGIAKRRNNLAHHNRYFEHDHRKPQPTRHEINEKALEKAIRDLLFCSERFFQHKIEYVEGKLRFKSSDGV